MEFWVAYTAMVVIVVAAVGYGFWLKSKEMERLAEARHDGYMDAVREVLGVLDGLEDDHDMAAALLKWRNKWQKNPTEN